MRIKALLFFALFLLTCGGNVFAQEPSLAVRAEQAYQKKDFAESAKLYQAAIDGGDTASNTIYNGACAYSLAGRKDEAFALLNRLAENTAVSVTQVTKDTDFDAIRNDPRWAKFIERAAAKEKRLNRLWNSPALNIPYAENISDDAKVAGLSKFWSEVKFNFANFDLVPDLDWDALYLEYLPKVRATKSTLEYYRVLTELCARLNDGHTNIYEPDELDDQLYAKPAVGIRLIEERVILRLVFDPALVADGVTPGLEILAVDGMPVKEYAAKFVAPYLCVSTPQDRESRLYSATLLNGPVNKPVELTLRDASGKEFKKTLPRLAIKARNALAPKTPSTEFKVLPGNIGYIALNQFENETVVKEFEAAFDEIAKTDALIIDIRNNGGGNSGNGYRILSYLTDQNPLKTSSWRTRQYRPSFRAWGTMEEWYDAGAGSWSGIVSKRYSKPVIVLISPRTFSAAEDFAIAFDVLKRGKMMGEPTGGSTGQPLFFKMPGGGGARVCTKRDRYPDGREFVGVGIKPDILVAQTFADFRAGRDTVLEAAADELRKAKK
jgi:C-terminal processing protease CtpA/Prc